MRGPVPNAFPSREPTATRIALVGESPGEAEARMGQPFMGASGHLLNSALSSVGLSREECFLGNVSQHRPSLTSNDFALLAWEGPEVQDGIAALLRDLAVFRPNIVVALGNVPLHLLRHGNVAPSKSPKKGYTWPSKITAWRGSLFMAHDSLGQSWKAMAAYHPAFILRAYAKLFDLRQDLRRTQDEGGSPRLDLPILDIRWGPVLPPA